MPTPGEETIVEHRDERLGASGLLALIAFQVLCVAVANYPALLTLGSTLPEASDTLQHLWVMRWYKTCLLEGRSVFLCPEIQYPVGAPLGNFSPLHLQSLLYLPLSFASSNDVLCYNLVWFSGLVFSAVGASVLTWHVVRDRTAAAFGGMLAGLSVPLMFHAQGGHTELVFVGGFPLFLVGWMRFVDGPSPGRLAAAVLLYCLVATCAAYFAVFSVFPAALFVGWRAVGAGRREAWTWLRGVTPWLLGFVGLSLCGLLLIFSTQIWTMSHGFSTARSYDDFERYRTVPWTYLLPYHEHPVGDRIEAYFRYAPVSRECVGYLGVVSIALLAYTLVHRVRVRYAPYLWSAFGLMVVLSFGASWTVGSHRVSLPAEWLWWLFPPFRMTRCPSRFSLFVAVIAAVLAASGLRHLLARLPGTWLRWAVFAGLAAVAVADRAGIPHQRSPLPAMPGCYAFLKGHDPHAPILEIPYELAGSPLHAACTYWQSFHRLTTSAGYSGQGNSVLLDRLLHNSPFQMEQLLKRGYLKNPERLDVDLIGDVDYREYVWAYLTYFQFDYVVLHRWNYTEYWHPVYLDRLLSLLEDGKVYEDAHSVVIDRSRLKPPTKPVLLSVGGWSERGVWENRWDGVAPHVWRAVVYNPDPDRPLMFCLDAAAFRRAQTVCLRDGSRELASWNVMPDHYQSLSSPAFRTASGFQELTLESLRRELNPQDTRAVLDDKRRPNHLRIARLLLITPDPGATARRGEPESDRPSLTR
jgi:hypothetical protein